MDLIKALGNEKRLQVLEWLRDPVANFPPQRDGDLVEDGVCALFIAEKLGISPPTCGEHLKLLSRAGPGQGQEDQAVGLLQARRGPHRPGKGGHSPVTGDTRAQHLVLTRDDIARAYDTIGPYLRRTPVVQLDLSRSGDAQARAAAVRRLVQGPRRVHEPPAQGRAAGRGGGRVRRQPRRRRRLRGAPAGHPGQDLRADRVLPRQDRAHPPAGGPGNRGRPLRRRARGRGAVDRDVGRDERARL